MRTVTTELVPESLPGVCRNVISGQDLQKSTGLLVRLVTIYKF